MITVGVQIVDDPSPAGDGLPAMDVPVFVGFAAKGPLQRPVALEDASQFEAVFGRPLELVLPAQGIQPLVAHLQAAVAGFFANGGRRCHVIRVAARSAADWGEAGASSARFALPKLHLALRGSLAALLPVPPGSPPLAASAWRVAEPPLQLRATSPGSWADRLELAARSRSQALHADDAVGVGDLLRASLPGPVRTRCSGWLRADRAGRLADVLAASSPTDWIWPADGAAAVTAGDWLVERVQVDLALREVGQWVLRREACGLSAGAGNLPWWAADADATFDTAPSAPSVISGWPLAGSPWALSAPGFDATSPDWLLLPLGLGDDFDDWQTALLDGRDALARNGLDRFDASLFMDPALRPGLRGQALRDWADDIRFLGSSPRRLQGLHGALGRDDVCAQEASWVLVPDAIHPGWAMSPPLPTRNGVVQAVADPPCDCPTRDFDDCAPPPPRPPQPPHIDFGMPSPVPLAADRPWQLQLRAATEPAPTAAIRLEVQLASQPDFSDAAVLIDALPPLAVPQRRPAGVYFMRARAHRLGLHSEWSAVSVLDVRGLAWQALPPQAAGGVCTQVHAALLDLCAASREHVALLSAPPDWPASTLAQHVRTLREHAAASDRDAVAASASFAALFHPGVLQRDGDGVLRVHPPEGLLAGLMARRSRSKGAWSAPGLEVLAGALSTEGELTEVAVIESLGANPLALRSAGVSAIRAATLSEDPDWSALGVRRLFILLRRLARREGERFAFEPNDAALRRSLERSFEALLQRLMQRGAFRGVDARSSYLLRTASGAAAAGEIERGECSLLIQVAPSRPLRFLTLHLLRAGEQLVLEER